MAPGEIRSEQINEIASALAKAQGALEGAQKSKVNPAFKTRYADLASVWEAAREPLSSNGLSVVQLPQETEAGMVLVTMLMHSSGQWISSRYPIRPVKGDPQGYGSALSYARRYSLMSVVGIAPEEDDGNAASGHGIANANGHRPPPAPAPAPRPKISTSDIVDTRDRLRSELARIKTVGGVEDLWARNLPVINEIRGVEPDAYEDVKADFRKREAEITAAAGMKPDDAPADRLPDTPPSIEVATREDGEFDWLRFALEALRIAARVPDEGWGAQFVARNKAQVAQLGKVRETIGTIDGEETTGAAAARLIGKVLGDRLDELAGRAPQAAE